MRRRVGRRTSAALALAAVLLVAVPAGALAAGQGVARGGDGWAPAWKRLVDIWDGMREALAGLVPTWERDTVPTKPGVPPPTEPEPPPTDGDPFDDGENGGGIDPNG